MSGQNRRVSENFKNIDIVMTQTLWIGTFPELAQDYLDYVAAILKEFFWIEFLMMANFTPVRPIFS